MTLKSIKLHSCILNAILSAAFVYWCYLAITTQIVMVHDSLGYQNLGELMYDKGLLGYMKSGISREPLYPFFTSLCMSLSNILNTHFLNILVCSQIFIMFISTLLMIYILQSLSIRPLWIIIATLYFCFSPALVNAMLSFYSEIITLPLILLVILFGIHTLKSFQNNQTKSLACHTLLFGLACFFLTMSKAAFELIFLTTFTAIIIYVFIFSNKKITKQLLIFSIVFLNAFFLPINGYKLFNKIHHDQYVLTGRGSWALYGNTKRRTDNIPKQTLLAAAAYVPGLDICEKIFSSEYCHYWTHRTSDDIAYQIVLKMSDEGYSSQEINQTLMTKTTDAVLNKPFQFIYLSFLESLKVFFWESTQIGFIIYPKWLQNMFNNPWIFFAIRIWSFMVCFFGFMMGLFLLGKSFKIPNIKHFSTHTLTVLLCVNIIFFFAFFHSFFLILARYMFPIAPAYILLFSIGLHHFWPGSQRPFQKDLDKTGNNDKI